MPLQRSGGLVGKLSREFATPDETGRFKQQTQKKQGKRHHENGHLRIGLLRQIGRAGRGDARKQRHGDGGQGEKAEKRDKAEFGTFGRRGCVHEIDVAILASTISIKHGNARPL